MISGIKTLYITNKITQLTEFLGGSVSCSGEYPAWPLARESKFREQCIAVYKNLYGKEPQVVTIHAGLECGILSEKIPGLDCISIGPNLKEIHTIKERASISSIARVWEFIKAHFDSFPSSSFFKLLQSLQRIVKSLSDS